jgi:ABC-2 type transport system permease protein
MRALVRFSLTQLLGGKRLLVLGLFAATSVFITWLGAVDSPADAAADTRSAVRVLLFPLLVPLVSLAFATAALGDEIGDGTACNIVLKPIERPMILLAKLAAALLAAAAVLVPTALAGHLLANGLAAGRLALATVAATAVGAFAYCALGLMLSLVTGRALVLGLAYLIFWEGVIVGLAPAAGALSIRSHTDGLFEALTAAEPEAVEVLRAALSSVAFSLAAFLLSARRFERMDLS